jgi:hypothetical protein
MARQTVSPQLTAPVVGESPDQPRVCRHAVDPAKFRSVAERVRSVPIESPSAGLRLIASALIADPGHLADVSVGGFRNHMMGVCRPSGVRRSSSRSAEPQVEMISDDN